MIHELTNLESFRIRLDKQGAEFICDTPLPAISASISFLGPISGDTVVWNMILVAIKCGEMPFIEIQQGSNGVYPVRVGLALPAIDEPVIKKTIIMMRNYKRLAIGRIEFGSMHT
jgi:hypothetical protein